jgi:hydrogenase-4 component F
VTWLLPLLLVCPLAAVACLFLGGSRVTPRLTVGATGLAFALALLLARRVLDGGPLEAASGWLRADALSALLACLVSGIALACAAYGVPYMAVVAARERADARWPPGRYEALVLALVACMLAAALANNLGLLWIAIEGGTLASALLVGYYRRPGAVEAGWKYLLLCSVAIALALLATVLLYDSAVPVYGEGPMGLRWSALREAAPRLDPRFVKLAFLFALVGYGAKAGLAPMHSWLPDAYTQAPAPAAALMSTALIAVSLAAVLRFHAVTAACVGPGWSGGLLALFGALSMALAVPFLLVQGEYKRLLAYSSIEHTGFVALAIGLGSPLAVFGGVLHLVVQSLAKSLAFLAGGTLGRANDSRRLDHWPGVLLASPALGVLFVGAGLGLAGLPPAATFSSEWLALAGGFATPRRGAAILALIAFVVAFAGIAFHWTRVALGRPRPEFEDRMPASSRAPLWALLALLVLFGVWLPAPVRTLIEQAAGVLRP